MQPDQRAREQPDVSPDRLIVGAPPGRRWRPTGGGRPDAGGGADPGAASRRR